MLGQAIGVTTAIKAGSQNIGFAVPIAAVRQTLPELLDVEHRDLLFSGLEFQAAPPCTVVAVLPESPAAAAGLRAGDVIVQLDGNPVEDRWDFDLALSEHRPGDSLRINWSRDPTLRPTRNKAFIARPGRSRQSTRNVN